MNAVIYARYSSDKQTEQSIEGQVRVCTEYAEKNGLQIVNTYVDRATSGTSAEHRNAFQRMIQDSAAGKFQAVLVYKLDRFARNRYDSAIYKAKLKKNGAKVVSATEQIADTPEGVIMEALLEGMDEYYSLELSRKCKRGIRESIIKGHNCGKFLFGYRREDKRYILDETTAPAVKMAFELYAGGRTMTDIAEILNSKGYRSINGNTFKRWGIYDMLHNDKYTGEHRIDGIPEIETCPQIISKDLFDKVQERLQKSANQARKSRTGHIYALTGLLNCGYCGGAICGSSTKNNGREYFYYTDRHENCEHRASYPAEKLEKTVVDALQEYLTADKVNALAEQLFQLYKAQENEPNTQAMLQEVNRKIQNVVQAIETIGVPSKALAQKLAELEQQRTELENQPITQPRLKLEHFRYFLERLTTTIETASDRRELFCALVNSVTLFEDCMVIALNIAGDKKPPELETIQKHLYSVGETSFTATQYKILFDPLTLLLFIRK